LIGAARNPQSVGMLPKRCAEHDDSSDEAVTRERLLDVVWGWEYPAGTRTVDTRMAELRRALNDDPAEPLFIETIPGEGYRFIAPVRGEG
jgi:DNA-binding winged helix-turn-helix (wHTH) protein